MEFLSVLLDVALILLLLTGIRYAIKLSGQLAEMRSSRADMEKFVLEFTSTVGRAEAGVRGLKNAARSCGDDLEKLIEKGQALRDELHFLTESADQMASRLSTAATRATVKPEASVKETPAPQASPKMAAKETASAKAQDALEKIQKIAGGSLKPTSTAERDLLRALEKLG